MEQLSLADTNVDWRALVEHVVRDSVSVEIQQGETTVARISPVMSGLALSGLNAALAAVPPLGDDAESFANDLKALRDSLSAEQDPWD
jgi:hypothetical protein